MPVKLKRYKVKVNDLMSIQELLQELYNEACKNIEEVQLNINKLSNSVNLNDETMDGKARYAKAINDFVNTKDKAIGRKLEIAKLMGEIVKHNGNVKQMSDNDIFSNFSIEELQNMASSDDSEVWGDEDKVQGYKIKK